MQGASKLNKRENFWGYLFISPQIIGLLSFVLFPVAMSFYLMFTEWDFTNAPKWTGTDNFNVIFHEENFYYALRNTLYFVLGIVPVTTVISLIMALLTNRAIKGLSIYKAAFFLPMVTSSVAIVLVWYWVFAPDIGLLNNFLDVIGITGPNWLTEAFWARIAIVIMSTWQGMGYYYLIFLAGLKGIPEDYYEAAEIDGAGKLRKFFNITLPLLSPTTFFIIVTMLIGVFNLFQESFILTGGGPAFSTYTLVMYIYDLAFRYFRMGEAAVVSVVLFAIVLLVTFIQFRLSKRWVNYIE
ncbi:carbohydrate ABC transporter permease [Paenibacillus sp. JDR-2]|uniref:carbohydrate ABC transporter permease n=1 Tax=Paenibacillus sp. (strain JDR-2) TaxID=324057 RepID=UPI0001666CE0|nr:sugar ABC transporter permease [Paenibacillus sp. JDR-2]ACT01230.1 binding-protein-dependent transport systems inner membrane component [Paenibacillus sp. JDR-2]